MHKTHGKSHTPLYNVWYAIKQRCYYVNNISIPKWKLYRDFKKGILPKGVTKINE